MGLFDAFKKPSGTPLLRALIERYRLQKKRPAEASLMVDWWEGRHAGRLLAFIEAGKKLVMYVGEPRLSASVQEVQINESYRGLSLQLDAGATPESVAADLAIALELLQALEATA